MTDEAIRSFCAQQREWLDLELQSEQEQSSSSDAKGENTNNSNEEGRSNVLQNLYASDISVGLYGRTVVQLMAVTSDSSEALLPAHRFTSGDEVEIHSKIKSQGAGGVVSEVTETSLSVALFSGRNNTKNQSKKEEDDEDENDIFNQSPLRVIPKSSIEVHRKYLAALQELDRHGTQHAVAGTVIRALFDNTVDTPPPPQSSSLDTSVSLDESQLESVSFCLTDNRPISLIHGPPGTGKTTTVAALIHQAVQQGMKVLVTAPSNVAVDNVLSKLMERPTPSSGNTKKQPSLKRLRVVRLGHPARLQPQILPYSLEALVQGADGTEIVADVRAELQMYLKILSKPKKSRNNDKRVAYREVKALRKEIRTREEKVVTELLSSAQVILATCVGAGNRVLKDIAFDLVVIDEAAQALEAACWIPVLKAKKVVLAGDHCQLPPTIKSSIPRVQNGLGNTMFERLMKLYGDSENADKKLGRISRMLRVQYRMHEQIASWASQALYGGQLQTHESVRYRSLGQLTGNATSEVAETTLLLVDTAGCDLHETVNASGSRLNTGEAQIVAQHIKGLLDMGVKQDQIAIITPYNGQVEVLRAALLPDAPKLEIRSVDGFQGGEREAVVLSLVRSSQRGGMDGIGFLRDDRRLNVAVTRAKRHCCVICDSETVSQSSFVKNLIDWIEEHGETRSALELMSDINECNVESDLVQAESLLQQFAAPVEKKSVRETGKGRAKGDEVTSDLKQKAILEKIETFVKTAAPGERMTLSSELSKFDRKMVHEFAEKNGITHLSEGQDGVDRRITIMIPSKEDAPDVEAPTVASSGDNVVVDDTPDEPASEEDEGVEIQSPPVASFAALQVQDDDTVESASEDAPVESNQTTECSAPNSLLANLAKERAERQKQSSANAAVESSASKKKRNKKKKGQKLGGTKKVQPKEEDNLDDLDDVAFLDAQIDKVQNSHGRKLDGKGGYRTVMNGILIAKPEGQEAKRNTAASKNLQSKLKQAQNSRKTKKKK